MTVSTVRPRCPACDLPSATCVCALVERVDNVVDVLLLQHPLEVREAKGSARLLRLGLARCRVLVGETFEPAVLAPLLHADGARSVVLYPDVVPQQGGGALEVRPMATQLVVIDATWRKSMKMLLSNALLTALPRMALAPGTPACYGALRKARLPMQLSTLEATCAALSALERDAARYAPMLRAFQRFVDDRVSRRMVEATPE